MTTNRPSRLLIGSAFALFWLGGTLFAYLIIPSVPAERTVFVPYQSPWLERYQSLLAGALSALGGGAVLGAGVLAYRGSVKAAQLTAEGAVQAAQLSVDQARLSEANARHWNERQQQVLLIDQRNKALQMMRIRAILCKEQLARKTVVTRAIKELINNDASGGTLSAAMSEIMIEDQRIATADVATIIPFAIFETIWRMESNIRNDTAYYKPMLDGLFTKFQDLRDEPIRSERKINALAILSEVDLMFTVATEMAIEVERMLSDPFRDKGEAGGDWCAWWQARADQLAEED